MMKTTPTVFVCPTCQTETTDECLSITLIPFAGRYCIYCYARWVQEHIPRLQVKTISGGH